MDNSRLTNINQLKGFLKGTEKSDLSLRKSSIDKKYEFIDKTVDRLEYYKLKKKDKKIVVNYLKKFTGYKPAQLYRLITRAKKGTLKRKKYKRVNPNRKYSAIDIKLLEKTDEFHSRLNSITTKAILKREYEVFGNKDYQNIAQISSSHINNLRKHQIYRASWLNHTKARQISIGITMPPENYGKPGSIKVDTVHQREIYHINSVDEITQTEIVVCVPQICEDCMKIALDDMIKQYPFIIFNFHSDRGGETINYVVANLLSKLLIKQTKSRARRPNDNALVETKNGSVIRKNMGWEHIHQNMTDDINYYYKNYFNPYLNYHRPCLFVTRTKKDSKGRERRIYENAITPYEKLKEISYLKKQNFLKSGITFDKLVF